MCGIVGVWDLNGEAVSVGVLKRMTDRISHLCDASPQRISAPLDFRRRLPNSKLTFSPPALLGGLVFLGWWLMLFWFVVFVSFPRWRLLVFFPPRARLVFAFPVWVLPALRYAQPSTFRYCAAKHYASAPLHAGFRSLWGDLLEEFVRQTSPGGECCLKTGEWWLAIANCYSFAS